LVGKIAALLSPCGTGNLGDAAIQDSLINGVRNLLPGAKFVGITLSVDDTETRHGIPAFPIDVMARGMPFATPRLALNETSLIEFSSDFRNLHGKGSAVTARYEYFYDHSVSRIGRVMRRVGMEVKHFFFALRVFRHVDLLIISGGGQIDDLWGGAKQHPLALFKWTLAAALRRRKILMISVGSGRLRSPLSRWFVTRALRRVDYASSRDRHSAHVISNLRAQKVDQVPDLALSYPLQVKSRDTRSKSVAIPNQSVGIAPMVFGDSRYWPENKEKESRRYMECLEELAISLIRQGKGVTLFSTTPADAKVAKELFEKIGMRFPQQGEAELKLIIPTTVSELVNVLQSVNLVVASRLHAVIMAANCIRPVLAIACEWKVERFLSELGLSRFCFRFADVKSSDLREGIKKLDAESESVASEIRNFRQLAIHALATQHDIVAREMRA
jgi:polysaccharide pyruvyl transferase WcaK-like protein